MNTKAKFSDLKLAVAVGAATLTLGISFALANGEHAVAGSALPPATAVAAPSTSAAAPAKAVAPPVATKKSRGS